MIEYIHTISEDKSARAMWGRGSKSACVCLETTCISHFPGPLYKYVFIIYSGDHLESLGSNGIAIVIASSITTFDILSNLF